MKIFSIFLTLSLGSYAFAFSEFDFLDCTNKGASLEEETACKAELIERSQDLALILRNTCESYADDDVTAQKFLLTLYSLSKKSDNMGLFDLLIPDTDEESQIQNAINSLREARQLALEKCVD